MVPVWMVSDKPCVWVMASTLILAAAVAAKGGSLTPGQG